MKDKKKVIVVFGTRPEAIKMCPLIKQIKKSTGLECSVCLTGQHREMLKQVMDVFEIEADYNLDIMRPNQTLSSITIDILNNLGDIIRKEQPDLILVHGDTTTSFAAGLAGFYEGVPIGHVEAGLRTYNIRSPYPEEFNRQAVDLIADLYFAPTCNSKENLLREGKKEDHIYITGNTVIDALSITVKEGYENENLDWAKGSRLILVTAHRRENLGEPMHNMFRAIRRIVEDFDDVKVIYPLHMNPKVRKVANEELGNHNQIRLIEPLDVLDFHNFMAKSYLILTDSGGIQEEAPALGKPVLVMRDTTERPEGIEAGTLKLVGTTEETIYDSAKELLTNQIVYEGMSKSANPYGDGHASERIIAAIESYFKGVQ
ncbi:MAG: UDP-N-acetylglucosamine 2-epimerase (non-hydrolyzing) [Lacrimispora sp.]|uniref:non-hydrolyzing UDP-N-acetylglucosamine 2-epimerase n=1 Tax=Lacrimispora sp. TaxID=2719234 RepID=UPI0039E35EE1